MKKIFLFCFLFLGTKEMLGIDSVQKKSDTFVEDFFNNDFFKNGIFYLKSKHKYPYIEYILPDKIANKIDGETIMLIGSVETYVLKDRGENGEVIQVDAGLHIELKVKEIFIKDKSNWLHIDSFIFKQKKYITLIDTFRKERKSKDGFIFKNHTGIQIPSSLINTLDKKKTKITFIQTVFSTPIIDYDSIVKSNGDVPQGRLEVDYKTKKYYMGGAHTSLKIKKIEIWSDKLLDWEIILQDKKL